MQALREEAGLVLSPTGTPRNMRCRDGQWEFPCLTARLSSQHCCSEGSSPTALCRAVLALQRKNCLEVPFLELKPQTRKGVICRRSWISPRAGYQDGCAQRLFPEPRSLPQSKQHEVRRRLQASEGRDNCIQLPKVTHSPALQSLRREGASQHLGGSCHKPCSDVWQWLKSWCYPTSKQQCVLGQMKPVKTVQNSTD